MTCVIYDTEHKTQSIIIFVKLVSGMEPICGLNFLIELLAS